MSNGTPAWRAQAMESAVCCFTPSSAATTRMIMSAVLAPRSLISVKAACPGVSMKVMVLPSCSAWYAEIAWVIPPASPAVTRVLRTASSRDVLPWSTCPIMVTTGARGWRVSGSSSSMATPISMAVSSMSSSSSSSSSSKSSSSPAMTLPNPSVTASHVGTSSVWEMAAMTPRSVIRYLMTDTGVSPRTSASSPTDIGVPGNTMVFLSNARSALRAFSAVRSFLFNVPLLWRRPAARPFLPVPMRRETPRPRPRPRPLPASSPRPRPAPPRPGAALRR
mmetsp:Transcript_7373/g.18293  ORF Transcript_7373/g.18293 Transcript_7373/m.18293 type:complete len:278 (-) Transcript_7373:87-920(-)